MNGQDMGFSPIQNLRPLKLWLNSADALYIIYLYIFINLIIMNFHLSFVSFVDSFFSTDYGRGVISVFYEYERND